MKLAIVSLKFQVVILKVTVVAIQMKNYKKSSCRDATQVAAVLAVSHEVNLIIYNRF